LGFFYFVDQGLPAEEGLLFPLGLEFSFKFLFDLSEVQKWLGFYEKALEVGFKVVQVVRIPLVQLNVSRCLPHLLKALKVGQIVIDLLKGPRFPQLFDVPELIVKVIHIQVAPVALFTCEQLIALFSHFVQDQGEIGV
jgi:hypothetical protein